MGFILGYVLGFAFGISVIVGFARYQNIRSKHRTHLLTWLNHQLDKIWPYVDEAASEIIRNSVEPILEQYRSAVLSSLHFSKLTLGTVAPQFTGVSILEGAPDEIIMELELQWDGNPKFILDIKTRVGVALPIQIKNIGFTGVFRLIFKPLVDEFPCFGAVCYSLREKETIRDAIEDSITWPVRKIIPILPGDYSYLELKPVGTLEVKLIEAKELSNKDIIGKSDPFAELFVRPLRDRIKTSKTIVLNDTLNPVWNQTFDFVVEDGLHELLILEVYDHDTFGKDKMGRCIMTLTRAILEGEFKDSFSIDGTESGRLNLHIKWTPQTIFRD
ncbi:UNVERIFIED_CONTAM: Synaptotagmin-5 [Sesamum calycinum]|uniref:Synaptotagmin-5 n=1 Tax=Sesamum calycinum TaxID=2727403 RepID=A0AAW2QY32_9LAMI